MGLERAYDALGNVALARQNRERAVVQWQSEAAPPSGLVSESVAEARYRAAERAADQCGHREAIMATEPQTGNRRTWDAWLMRRYHPWGRRQRACEQAAYRLLGDVVRLHVPRWEAAALALAESLQVRFSRMILTTMIPPDVRRNPELLDAWCGFHTCR